MADTSRNVRVAAVQASAVFLDGKATVEKGAGLIEQAAKEGAEVIVFPETWVPGYPVWATRIPAWRLHEKGQRLFGRLFENSVDVPGPLIDVIAKAARKHGVHVVLGVNERESEFSRGTLYNTIVYFGRDGAILGKHRKLTPTFHERVIWGAGDASGLGPIQTDVGRIGGLVCWEHWVPLAAYSLAAQGEQIHAAQWPSVYGHDEREGEMVQTASRHYAYQNRSFVIAACGWMEKSDLPADFELAKEAKEWPDRLLFGGSAIIAPDGRYLVGPSYEGEDILYADLDLAEIPRLKQSLDVAGHYTRPDIFQVTVDRSRRDPLNIVGMEPETPAHTESGA
ncbi:MAG: carbon-nitrogen hydrolase family protein [SAR202 cluster bacterium]|nr:carbon-nitrogen hydrolase family protein [SAR202 cluster bacterium]